MDWQAKLNDGGIVLLDGGTGSELQRRGVPMSGAAWSGAAVHTHPDVLRAVHHDYIAAGAEVIITNTFGTSRSALSAAGLGDAQTPGHLQADLRVRRRREGDQPQPDALTRRLGPAGRRGDGLGADAVGRA